MKINKWHERERRGERDREGGRERKKERICLYVYVLLPTTSLLLPLLILFFFKVGDGTTSVVIIASELLRVADELVMNKIHPTSVIGGFRLAQKEAVKYIQVYADLLCILYLTT